MVKVKVIEKRKINKDSIIIKTEKPFDYKPGQYIALINQEKKYYFSIASYPQENYLLFYIKLKPSIKFIEELDEWEIEGPYGNLFDKIKDEKKIKYIVMGSGIAPVRSLALYFDLSKDQEIIYQERKVENLIFIEDLKKVAKVICILSQEKTENCLFGHVQDYLYSFIDKEATYIIVGSSDFNNSIKEMLEKEGVKKIYFTY